MSYKYRKYRRRLVVTFNKKSTPSIYTEMRVIVMIIIIIIVIVVIIIMRGDK